MACLRVTNKACTTVAWSWWIEVRSSRGRTPRCAPKALEKKHVHHSSDQESLNGGSHNCASTIVHSCGHLGHECKGNSCCRNDSYYRQSWTIVLPHWDGHPHLRESLTMPVLVLFACLVSCQCKLWSGNVKQSRCMRFLPFSHSAWQSWKTMPNRALSLSHPHSHIHCGLPLLSLMSSIAQGFPKGGSLRGEEISMIWVVRALVATISLASIPVEISELYKIQQGAPAQKAPN